MTGLALAGRNVVDAWVKGARAVAGPNFDNDHLTLVAEQEWQESPAALRALDRIADRIGIDRPSGVADVLCPTVIFAAQGSTQQKIARGWNFFGRGRGRGIRFSGWRDTYFERITGHHASAVGAYETLKENRLLHVIEKINLWDHNVGSSLYAHTDLSTDSLRTRGAPCLQYVQFRVFDGNRIGVTGLYRSHDYLSKALGNLIGLQRLARFVGQETGRQFGRVTVVSLVPIAEKGKGKLRQYADGIAQLL